ncbi:sterol 26-hydroxylase, mitochondrial-like [Megalops cyprinoides]|uniref:sterol 26-hydroxylase, mitochondrial-like n=1 Tax=Megalops cyprinoides TaxID=118141 RepID=UPI0018646383|nr:sterol 26-hydroxylase, mitochondrial-like [Megalops cyprinoides]
MAVRLALSSAKKELLRPVKGVFAGWRKTGTSASASVSVPANQGKFRNEDDLPCIGSLQLLYRVVFQGYLKRMHELQVYEKQLYGSIYKVRAGGYHSIALNSVEFMEELLRKDEKFPCRGDMTIWTEYRDLKGIGYGPFTEEGERWYQLRAILNKRMLHPKDSVQYGDVINEVVTDFVKRIYHIRQASSSGDLVTDLSNELYRFALEGISTILFETRIGCLENEIPAETQDFIDSIGRMFSYSMIVVLLPKWTRNLLPFWGQYISGWDGIFRFARKLIDSKMKAIQQRVDLGQEVEGEYLTYLLSNKKLTNKDVYGSIAELLLAGVDTTSNTMMWALYELSRAPEVQDRLHKEVSSCVSADRIPTAQDFARMPYLKAVIKETLRRYPVVPMNARLMTESNVSIGGYFFPKKTTFTLCHYAMSQDEKIFPEPWKFKPERWLRDGQKRSHPFGSIPFGYGVRGCVGRRIAELEMYLALSRIIRLFEIRPDPSVGEVKALNRTVLVADRQVNLHFLERDGISAH